MLGRSVKNGSVFEAPGVGPHCVVVCGQIEPHRKWFSDTASEAAGITLIRCAEDLEKTLPLLKQLNASLFIARQEFIEQLPPTAVLLIANLGKRCRVLAVLESEALEAAPAGRMLRLGCRGVLPRRFSCKLFRRAVLAVLKGEIWAPPCLVSDLVSELLRAASLQSERGLTPQESRILELSSQGLTNSAIADALFISLGTVRWHKRHINRKLREGIQPRFPHAKVTPAARKLAAG